MNKKRAVLSDNGKFAINKAFLKNLFCFRLWIRLLNIELRAFHFSLKTYLNPTRFPYEHTWLKKKHCPSIAKWWNVVCCQRIKTVLCVNLTRKVREKKETQNLHFNKNFLLKSIPAERVQNFRAFDDAKNAPSLSE